MPSADKWMSKGKGKGSGYAKAKSKEIQNGISNAKTKEEKEEFYSRLVARMDLLCFFKLGDYFSFISDFNLGRIREYFIFHVDFQESEDVESCETTQYKEYTR